MKTLVIFEAPTTHQRRECTWSASCPHCTHLERVDTAPQFTHASILVALPVASTDWPCEPGSSRSPCLSVSLGKVGPSQMWTRSALVPGSASPEGHRGLPPRETSLPCCHCPTSSRGKSPDPWHPVTHHPVLLLARHSHMAVSAVTISFWPLAPQKPR